MQLAPSAFESPASGFVKSADRVLQLFELFRAEQCAMGAREIAARLDIPRSSVTVLLRGLVAQDYLRANLEENAYFPTMRVGLLGRWLTEALIDSDLREASAALSKTTGETICIWADTGPTVSIVSVEDSPQPVALALSIGQSAPLLTSGVGMAMLLLRPLEMMANALVAHQRFAPEAAPIDLASLEAQWRDCRAAGHVIAYSLWLPDAGVVAVPLRSRAGEPLVLAVGGPAFRIRAHQLEILDALRKVTELYDFRVDLA